MITLREQIECSLAELQQLRPVAGPLMFLFDSIWGYWWRLMRQQKRLNWFLENRKDLAQRIKAMEAEIGTALFKRHSRGMTLTGAGRRLLPYAQQMAALSREAVLAARDDGVPKGPLAIGSMETTAAVRLPSLLAEFHRRFPAVRLSLRTEVARAQAASPAM